jgi:hypothetical protein
MLDLVRPLRVLALTIAFMGALTASASASGALDWNNLGARAGSPGVAALDGRVDVLNTDMPGKLIAGGAFLAAGQAAGNTVFDDHIAIWNGTSWKPLRNTAGAATDGLNGDVRSLAFAGGKIYAGGVFTNAGGNAGADFLAVWDTTSLTPSWQSICSSSPNGGNVDALKIVGNTMYVGGSFGDWGAAGPGNPRDYLIACDLTTGVSSPMVVSDGDATGAIKALAVDGNGDLYAGGNFGNWGGIATADYVVKYDLPSNAMSGTASGIDSTGVDSLATYGTDLYVGTDDVNVAGIVNADAVVKWDGAAWSAVGQNNANTNGYFGGLSFPPDVQALTVGHVGAFNDAVFASGNWINANGDARSDDVAGFFPNTWIALGGNANFTDGPLSGNLARGLTLYNGNLIVGGNFADGGGDPLADSIACFQWAGRCAPAPVPTPPPVVTPPPPASAAAAATATGRRAAALKKCKKKSGDARAKCKKKAKKLPV